MNDAKQVTKVGFVTNIYTPYKEAMFREIAKWVDLKVYYCAYLEKERDWTPEFSNTYSFEILKGKTFVAGKRNLHFNPTLPAILTKDKNDLVIVGEWGNPTVALLPFWLRLKSIPRILWSGSTMLETRSHEYFTTIIKKLIISQYHGYVTYTTKAAEYVISLGARKDRVTIAPVTVDTDFFKNESDKLRREQSKSELRAKHGLRTDEVVIFFVGQITLRKGVDLLLKAITRLENKRVRLILAGTGSKLDEFKELATKISIEDQVRFLGYCNQHTLLELYVCSDIFTLPSRADPSGNVINEAMTVGLPVVVSNKIGCDCVEHGESGYIFESENIDNYMSYLSKLIADEDLRKKMGLSARKNLLKNFSIQEEARKFSEAIEKTLYQRQRTVTFKTDESSNSIPA